MHRPEKSKNKLRAVVVKNRAGQKVTSEYAGKFSDQSVDTSHFYRTRKVDDGFFPVKFIILELF
jgi:hypothetical protein